MVPPAVAPRLATPDAPSGGTRLALPADFDVAAFERISKTIFIRLQAAHDSADLNDLRAFTTPELFASLRLSDLQDRGSAAQQTDVVTLNAELLDFAQESEQQVVSVRFHWLDPRRSQRAGCTRSTRCGISCGRSTPAARGQSRAFSRRCTTRR